MQIVFKRSPEYPQIEREFSQLDKRLYPIIEFMRQEAWQRWGDILVVTRIADNDGSTHSNPKPYRFIDFAILESDLVGSDINTSKLTNTEALRNMVNVSFPYGVKGYETIAPLRHGTAPHAHVQLPKNASLSVWYGKELRKEG